MNAENLYNTMYAAPIEGLERCYTIQEIAGHLNISISSTRKLVAAGYLPVTKIGHQQRVYESDLIKFMKQTKGKNINF